MWATTPQNCLMSVMKMSNISPALVDNPAGIEAPLPMMGVPVGASHTRQ